MAKPQVPMMPPSVTSQSNPSSPVTPTSSKPSCPFHGLHPVQAQQDEGRSRHWAPWTSTLASVGSTLLTAAGGIFSNHTALITSHAYTQVRTLLLKTLYPKIKPKFFPMDPGLASTGLSIHTPPPPLLPSPPLSSYTLRVPFPHPPTGNTLPPY